MLDLQVENDAVGAWGQITAEIRGRGRTVANALRSGSRLLRLWEATLDGDLDVRSALDLLRAGEPGLLVGQPETQWLEAKAQPRNLEVLEEEFKLARDVAAMANGGGGIIVIGLGTTKVDGEDEVNRVSAIPFELLDVPKFRSVIERLVFPPPEGLEIWRVETEPNRGVCVLSVPEQPPGVAPLLIQGAIIGEKISGSHISLVRRRGSHTDISHPATLHSLIAAGRVALGSAGADSLSSG